MTPWNAAILSFWIAACPISASAQPTQGAQTRHGPESSASVPRWLEDDESIPLTVVKVPNLGELQKGGIHIYSFLGAVPGEFSEDLSKRIYNALYIKLNLLGIFSKYSDAKNSQHMKYFSRDKNTEHNDYRPGAIIHVSPFDHYQTYSYRIPVSDIINEDKNFEYNSKFKYNLYYTPEYIEKRGAWIDYRINFFIEGVEGRPFWSYSYHMKEISFKLEVDGSPASKIAESVLNDLVNKGILPK